MEYVGILVAAAAVVLFFLLRQKPAAVPGPDQADATFVCDVCGEHECLCREEKKQYDDE